MSFINSALIQKLTQQVDELTQRVVVLEGGGRVLPSLQVKLTPWRLKMALQCLVVG